VQGFSTLWRVELAGEALGRDGVQVELTMRIAASGEDEHRTPSRCIQVVLWDVHRIEHEPDECDEQLALQRLVAGGLERL
jgi:hypothetical protein